MKEAVAEITTFSLEFKKQPNRFFDLVSAVNEARSIAGRQDKYRCDDCGGYHVPFVLVEVEEQAFCVGRDSALIVACEMARKVLGGSRRLDVDDSGESNGIVWTRFQAAQRVSLIAELLLIGAAANEVIVVKLDGLENKALAAADPSIDAEKTVPSSWYN